MSNVKGAAVTARLRYIRERHASGGYERFVAALAPATRTTLADNVLQHAWVPFDAFVDIIETADDSRR